MVRRLLNFLRKPFLGLPDSVQPIVIRELDDMESIHQDFTNHGVLCDRPSAGTHITRTGVRGHHALLPAWQLRRRVPVKTKPLGWP